MLSKSLQSFSHSFSAQGIQLDFGTAATTAKLPGATGGDPNTAFGALIAQGLNIALVIGTVAVLLFLILGAIEWITAGGDSGKIQKAREKITQAVIGLVVLISTVAIMIFAQQLMGVCTIDFGQCGGGSKSSTASPAVPSCADVDPNASCVVRENCDPRTETTIKGACGGGRVCCKPTDKL